MITGLDGSKWTIVADPAGQVRTYTHIDDGVLHYAAVDSSLTDAQILSGLGPMTAAEEASQARYYGARAVAGLSQQIRTMTAAQAEAYINANVTSLATAKVVLVELSRLVIALRDQAWRDMQGG